MILGTETELSLAINRATTTDEKALIASEIIANIPLITKSIKNYDFNRLSPGFMTSNGSRFYLDTGNYLEIATPEVRTPMEAIIYQKANESIILNALSDVTSRRDLKNSKLIKASTDYENHFRGFHVNIMTSKLDINLLVEFLIPFLISRFYSCSGGFGAAGFQMTQKHRAIEYLTSTDPRQKRSIVDLRNESLSEQPFKRIHITHGENCMSDLCNFLSIGATALVIRMLDEGAMVGLVYKLLNPLKALEQLDTDYFWNKPLKLVSGHYATPLEIQEHYLKAAEVFASKKSETWMTMLVNLWREVLEILKKNGPFGLSQLLDPYIKLQLVSLFLKDHGISLNEFSMWCRPVILAKSYLKADYKIDIRGYLHERMPYTEFQFLEDQIKFNFFDWSDLPRFMILYNKILMLDILFHDIDPSGLFSLLCRSNFVDIKAQLVKKEDIAKAVYQAPQDTRAKARSQAIIDVCRDDKAIGTWEKITCGNRQTLFRNPLSNGFVWHDPTKLRTKK